MLINFCKKQKYTFDFSWIEKEVSQWVKSTPEDLRRMIEVGLPCGITHYIDFGGSNRCIFTHLGEIINDYDDYKRQKKEFCESLVRKYAKKSC